MIDETINCDHCGTKLNTPTHYEANYYLELSMGSAPRARGHVYDTYIIPPLERRMQFCGFKCLENWLKRDK